MMINKLKDKPDLKAEEVERALRESEEKYKAAFHTNPDSVVIAGLDGLCIEVNESFTRLTGYSEEEIIGKTTSDINLWVIQEDRERVIEGVKQNGFIRNLETVFRCKDGSHITGLMSASLIELNNIPHLLSITHDISDRIKLEEVLKLSEEKYRSITENANEGIVIAQDNVYKYVNPKMCEILEYSEKELVGSSFIDKIHPDDRKMITERHKRRLSGEKFLDSYDFKCITKAGVTKWIKIKPVLITWEDAPATLNFMSDITGQKKSEIALIKYKNELEETVEKRTKDYKRAKEEAEKANELKSQFLANISHELRNPMHQILSYSKHGVEKINKPKEKLWHYFNQTKKAAERLMVLLNDLLDLSKMESGKMDYQMETSNIFQIVNEIALELKPSLKERNLFLKILDPSIPTKVACDFFKIGQVMRNLLANAIKYTSEGKSIEVNFKSNELNNENRTNPSIQVSVCDQGVGIPENELGLVFDKFTQSSKTKTGAGGTGLGLAICKEIIDAHHGKIWVENNPEGGTTFSFTLPYEQKAI
jgi:PAS domain S-box-containing protein